MDRRIAIIDGDGHVFDNAGEITPFMPPIFREAALRAGVFPSLDHFHPFLDVGMGKEINERAFGEDKIGPRHWLAFLEETGLEASVLYPTWGLASAKIPDPNWAVAATCAYNDWLHQTYLKASPRLKGMALLPIQEPQAAVRELRRAVKELGMCGAMIPSNGVKRHLGAPDYWPIYREAADLGCCIAVHGGCHDNLGLNDLNVFAAAHALGHPFGIMISFIGMLYNGVFDKFPGTRFAFLEAGVAWFLMILERAVGSYNAFRPADPSGNLLLRIAGDEGLEGYIRRHIEAGRVFLGCEGDEELLPTAVKKVGSGPFIYSSDFPHEVTAASCRKEIEELLAVEELSSEDKRKILGSNARRFYALE